MNREEELLQLLTEAVKSRNTASLETHADTTVSWLAQSPYFPEALFRGLIALVSSPFFGALEDAIHMLRIFSRSIEMLSDSQKAELLFVLQRFYPTLQDPTACMCAAEIIADLFQNERSLETLLLLSKTSKSEIPRALVAYGLGYLGAEYREESLPPSILNRLMQMCSDPSDFVREEAEGAIAQIKKKA